MRRTLTLTAALTLALGAPAAAQVGILVHGSYDSTRFEARRSFEAVTGASSVEGATFGVSATRLWRGIFVDVAAAKRTIDGERVFVHAGSVFRLGIPAAIEWRPLDIAAGWRFELGRVAPYAGVGATTISYTETARFAQAGDDVSESASGVVVLGGVDVAVWRWINVGGEVRYRSVKGVLGVGGASEAFGEDQLGGTSAAVRVSFGR
jgi:hypothetical protein